MKRKGNQLFVTALTAAMAVSLLLPAEPAAAAKKVKFNVKTLSLTVGKKKTLKIKNAKKKAKWSISFELGYSKKPALHGRLNSSTDTEIRKFLMEFRRIFMSKYYDYFEEQEHNSGEITMDNAHE